MCSLSAPRNAAGLAARFAFGAIAALVVSSATGHASPAVQAAPAPGTAAQGAAAPASAPSAEDEALYAEERREADLDRRRGRAGAAITRLEELLGERPGDVAARALLAAAEFDLARYADAEKSARKALDDAQAASGTGAAAADLAEPAARARRTLVRVLTVRGNGSAAVAACAGLSAERDARDAWRIGQAQLEFGARDAARAAFAAGAGAKVVLDWEGLLAMAQCARSLGDLSRASELLVAADESTASEAGHEPDVLVALGEVYFEADKEVSDAERRSPAALCKEALRLDPVHEGATLLLYRLHRYNWRRGSRSATEILAEHLARRPESIEALLLATGADLDDGQLKSARARLADLERLAPRRRAVRTLAATLAWIEHREDECRAALEGLVHEDPHDSVPERETGRHLLELYRFAEGLPFVRAATERDPADWEAWTQLGRALANTGAETEALAALQKAEQTAGGRQDIWRNNTRSVLTKMAAEHKREGSSELVFAWNENAAEILRTYLVPFYTESRAELASRYGYTPGLTAIEVFAKHKDFSVRSTGFEGFPALGVCFGPVVTAVSPLSELRGTFSWARTSFHEFTHVIHLGLSHNRCPRWVTEGLATWEEVHKNPAWTRNMRRELVDALANDDLIPVRELNRAFRGPRILFGYYQGGLLCQMLIERSGFPPMVRLLEAFDRGDDLDAAFQSVFHTTPEVIDADFHAFVVRETQALRIEPRWSDSHARLLRLALADTPPAEPAARAAWAENWCTVAWEAWQSGRRVDAQEALRHLVALPAQPARAQFLRGEMKLKDNAPDEARVFWASALDSGGEDFRVRMALGILAVDAHKDEIAETNFLAAQKLFPGFDERPLAAELELAKLYERTERHDLAMAATERWLAFESGAPAETRAVAAWHAGAGRFTESLAFFARANEIDPFVWRLHEGWGDALAALGKHAEAEREFRVAQNIPATLEGDREGAADVPAQARLAGKRARELVALGRTDEGLTAARGALELDPDCEIARAVLGSAR